MIRVRLHTSFELDPDGAIARVDEDGVWSVLESKIADDLEILLNLHFGELFEPPEGEYNPYPSYWRAREAIEMFSPGEILLEVVDDPFVEDRVY